MDWKKLLESIPESVDDELRLRNAYLVAENRILRQQITGRLQLTDSDRKQLSEIGAKLGKTALEEIATIALPDTILAWHHQFTDQKGDTGEPRKSVGRPRMDPEIEALVVRMARENRTWGYDRIQGALTHLGYAISDQTVGQQLETSRTPTGAGTQEDRDLEGIYSYPQGHPHGHGLLQQRGVGLVGTGDSLPLQLVRLCS
jgi:putative transposase